MVSAEQPAYVVTGASRGIGLEFVKQLLESGNKVVAAARNPNKAKGLEDLASKYPGALSLVSMDVSKSESIKAAAETIAAAFPDGVDVLINNAGISGAFDPASKQDDEEFKEVLMTNVLGPFLVVKAFLPLIKKGKKKQVLQISSSMGSIGACLSTASPNPLGRYCLAYRVSKAALNMETAALAVDLREEGITLASLHPGWVATDMGQSGGDALRALGISGTPIDAQTSVAGMLSVVGSLTLAKSGSFLDYKGEVMPF